jgi:hypothetical protein
MDVVLLIPPGIHLTRLPKATELLGQRQRGKARRHMRVDAHTSRVWQTSQIKLLYWRLHVASISPETPSRLVGLLSRSASEYNGIANLAARSGVLPSIDTNIDALFEIDESWHSSILLGRVAMPVRRLSLIRVVSGEYKDKDILPLITLLCSSRK